MITNNLSNVYRAQSPKFGAVSEAKKAKIDAFMKENDLEIKFSKDPGGLLDGGVLARLEKKGVRPVKIDNGNVTMHRVSICEKGSMHNLAYASGIDEKHAMNRLYQQWPNKGTYHHEVSVTTNKEFNFNA